MDVCAHLVKEAFLAKHDLVVIITAQRREFLARPTLSFWDFGTLLALKPFCHWTVVLGTKHSELKTKRSELRTKHSQSRTTHSELE